MNNSTQTVPWWRESIAWFKRSMKNYKNFSGRASRREYWFTMLVYAVLTIVANILNLILIWVMTKIVFSGIDENDPWGSLEKLQNINWFDNVLVSLPSILALILIIVITVPMVSLGVRRWHDLGYGGWPFFIGIMAGGAVISALIPYANYAVSAIGLYFMTRPGTSGENQYGPEPRKILSVGP